MAMIVSCLLVSVTEDCLKEAQVNPVYIPLLRNASISKMRRPTGMTIPFCPIVATPPLTL
jgi:hypothetical protein